MSCKSGWNRLINSISSLASMDRLYDSISVAATISSHGFLMMFLLSQQSSSFFHELPCHAPICNANVLLKNMIGKHEIPIRECTLIITVLIRKNIYDWVQHVDWICFRFIFTEVFSFHSKFFFWYQISLCNILNIRTFRFRCVENPELVDVVDNILVIRIHER